MTTSTVQVASKLKFIDLFAGCGGFSLGFLQAGWQGVFAIEKEKSAFCTFSRNFLQPEAPCAFEWPDWLPKKNHDIRLILRDYKDELKNLQGSVDLIIGGPPCQGFSFAGARKRTDRRNLLFKAYLKFVRLVRPRFVLIENVRGICIEHGKRRRLVNRRGRPAISYSKKIVQALRQLGYCTGDPELINACEYGVPQRRPRVFFFAFLSDQVFPADLFVSLKESRKSFLEDKGLATTRSVKVEEAISDLLRQHGTVDCEDPWSPSGFQQGLYGERETTYQQLLRNGHRTGTEAQSHRFVNHKSSTVERFEEIQKRFRKGVQLHRKDREQLEIGKHSVVPLKGDQTGHTLTTLPDDYIHYSEPRILTVREYARLQSFPDWFTFEGPFTTGGPRRKNQCPRYTQIGNAVPPLLAEALARALSASCNKNGLPKK